jgi:hypothetical protein
VPAKNSALLVFSWNVPLMVTPFSVPLLKQQLAWIVPVPMVVSVPPRMVDPLARVQRRASGNGAQQALANAKGQSQQCDIGVPIARDCVQRYGQHNCAHSLELAEHNGQAYLEHVLSDARKLRSDRFAAGRLAEQDHAGDANRDVKQESETGDPCIRCGSHVRSWNDNETDSSSRNVGEVMITSRPWEFYFPRV